MAQDLPEFLQLRTNNGDERMKAHDVFPAVCYPDLFWRMVRENMDQDWYLMCPHEIMTVKGYCLEDSFGEEWERRYWDCVHDARIKKRTVLLKDLDPSDHQISGGDRNSVLHLTEIQ